MDAQRSDFVTCGGARRRLLELDEEVRTLFRTVPVGPELVSRWGELILEIQQLRTKDMSPNARSSEKVGGDLDQKSAL